MEDEDEAVRLFAIVVGLEVDEAEGSIVSEPLTETPSLALFMFSLSFVALTITGAAGEGFVVNKVTSGFDAVLTNVLVPFVRATGRGMRDVDGDLVALELLVPVSFWLSPG